MTPDWPAFAEIVRQHKNFLLTSHIRPDCDALGSELGMAGVLRAAGKQVRIVNGQPTPQSLAFMDERQEILVYDQDISLAEMQDAEVLIILDTSAWAQLGPMGEAVRQLNVKKLIVDHHVSEDDLGAVLFKNTSAEAAGRLVVEAADALDVQLTPEMARPLFAALATDTGWFRFGSTDEHTYRLGARLIEAGARPEQLYNWLYEQDTIGRLRLRGLVLTRIELEQDDELAYTYILRDDFARTTALPSDTEDLVNMMLSIEGVKAAIIFIEQLDGGFKVSFRSRCRMNCSEIAGRFGGGGHKAAAGAMVVGDLDEVKTQVLDAVRAAM